MKPSSAMALASRMSGHSDLACAFAGTGVVVVTRSAASAAERRRSRFVNMVAAPLGDDCVRAVGRRRRSAGVPLFHWAEMPTVVCDFTIGGGFHLPVSTSDFGL